MAFPSQHGAQLFRRGIAVLTLFLVLSVTGLEATHIHPDRLVNRESGTRCLICISVHANAPVVVNHPLPVLHAVGVIALPNQATGKSITARLELYTRPPPALLAGPAV